MAEPRIKRDPNIMMGKPVIAAAQIRALGDGVLGQLAVIEPGRVRLRPLPGGQTD